MCDTGNATAQYPSKYSSGLGFAALEVGGNELETELQSSLLDCIFHGTAAMLTVHRNNARNAQHG